jgi:hypothetical protein
VVACVLTLAQLVLDRALTGRHQSPTLELAAAPSNGFPQLCFVDCTLLGIVPLDLLDQVLHGVIVDHDAGPPRRLSLAAITWRSSSSLILSTGRPLTAQAVMSISAATSFGIQRVRSWMKSSSGSRDR